MKLLILGAGGFIGSYLTKRLVSSTDHQITVVDLSFERFDTILSADQSGLPVTRRTLDIRRHQQQVRDLIHEHDMVVDLIAHANPSQYVADPLNVVELNFFENWKIAEAVHESGGFLLQFSSCEVYGLAEGNIFPFSEDTSRCVLGPIVEERWIYSAAKQLLERMIYARQRDGLRFCLIRPFNFIGPGMDYLPNEMMSAGPRVVPHFIGCLLRGAPLPLVNGGTSQRSYTYIDDAVDGIARVIQEHDGAFRNQIVNVGHPDNETSIRDLAWTMIRLFELETGTRFSPQVQEVPGATFYGDGYADCDRRIPDVSKLTAVGWQPQFGLEDALRATLTPYLRNELALVA